MTNNKQSLLIHGFTGGTHELEPLANYLRERDWGCSLPLLPGHGNEHTLQDVTYEQWIWRAEMEAAKLASRYGSFDLVGFSMGGMIASYIANRYPVRKLVLLNAALIYVSPRRFIRTTWEKWKRNEWKQMQQLDKIQNTPVTAVIEFMKCVRDLSSELHHIKVPTLVVQGMSDEVVHPYSAYRIKKRIHNDVYLKTYPKSKHLICLDCESDQVFSDVHHFLSSNDIK
ncbi:alpha/beta hydrolase [Longirhabdus pacifica]|uniref:alpha/beta hydrolase n=1 Tax=Longirhabdus pacifica TaxID=2305227 RepID=UPI0013E8D7E2|nr:alpha/beta fold hydrolase [Longirhabdus pacifica]